MTGRWQTLCKVSLGLTLAAAVGCQTWVPEAGLTLPSPHYLKHLPQYTPPSPPFPLPVEQANLEAASAQQTPPPVPPVQGGGPVQ